MNLINPNENIELIENNSDSYTTRARIVFVNGYELSIIRGAYTYGGSEGLCEIAIFDQAGNYCPHLFNDDHSGDDVAGYLTEDEVRYYIHLVSNI